MNHHSAEAFSRPKCGEVGGMTINLPKVLELPLGYIALFCSLIASGDLFFAIYAVGTLRKRIDFHNQDIFPFRRSLPFQQRQTP
jgi:hypothetical protein